MNSVTQLTPIFSPKTYDIALDINRKSRSYSGTVQIIGALHQQDKGIALHAKDLSITSAVLDGKEVSFAVNAKADLLTVAPETSLIAGEHELIITFTGKITDTLHGLYPGYYKEDGEDKELLVTQCESHHAREIFPCIDEPAAKAVFTLQLTTETGVAVIANTPVANQQEEAGRLLTSFHPTPKMSTYLLAFVIGELEHLDARTSNGTLVRTFATKEHVASTKFALEVGVKALEFYNDFFDEPYPLEKCDLIAVPDFSAGAMENWGCVTFRESALLVDPTLSDLASKQWVAQVVIHELAHQWFGNLVTMQWWNDLWLNEGFARFMESYVATKLFPEWNLDIDFLATNTTYAMRTDSLINTHPIQVEVHHPDEISTIFDAISYEKGAAVIRMLLNYLGEEQFRNGLRHYIKNHRYGNTVTTDLWQALSDSANKDVAQFTQPWIEQAGFPLITITETSENSLELRQQRFFSNPLERKEDDPTIWPIPLLSTNAGVPDILENRSLTIPKPKDMFELNKEQTGFYFIAYTAEQRAALAATIADGKMGTADRLGLLNEAFELSKAGYISTTEVLQLLEAYQDENDEHVWTMISLVLGGIRLMVDSDTAAEQHLNTIIRRLVTKKIETVGWEPAPNESTNTPLLRQILVGAACRADDPKALQEALRRFDASADGTDIPADIRPAVYTTAVRKRGLSVVTALLERHQRTSFDEERTNLAIGICSATEESAITTILDYISSTKNVKSQNLGYWFAYLMRNTSARTKTWQWMQEKWSWISELYEGDKSYDHFARYSSQVFTTQDELTAFRNFFEPKGAADPGLTRAVKQGIEGIELRVEWGARDLAAIKGFLQTSASQSETVN